MATGVPLTARALANSHQYDSQRIANPRLEVNERRLRPIYDFMEIHNYRKALTEIDRLLKKQANFTACKALKCLVLLKLERHDEARQLANELDQLASAPTRTAPAGDASNVDENALTFFSQYYKDLRQFDKVVWLYECAVKREATSEEFLCSLFMAYVRIKDYKNQVLTAQKLYKLTRKIPYYNWAVISVLLQIDENSSQLKQTLYIPMALKMLEKEFFDENQQQQAKVYGEMECLLYLHTLELKEDYPKALNFFEKHLDALIKSPSNESMLPAYFSHDKPLIYNYKSGNYEKTYQLAKQYLKEDNYLWNWYEVLFDTFFKFDQTKQEELMNDLHDFILSTPDDVTDLRNIHLSRIELGLRWQIYKSKNDSVTLPQLASTYLSDSFFNQLTTYIEKYSFKTTGLVMYDIYRSFEFVSNEERQRLHQYLINQIPSDISENNIQYLINILYCARLCGDIHSQWLSENSLSLLKRLIDLAKQSLTPSQLAIELFTLIINMMDERKQPKIDLYNLLDYIYDKDTTNFDVKLYLYRLALDFNSITIMKDFFERLEIKNIQYFSLSYLLTDHYLRIHRNYRHIKNYFNYVTNILLVYTDDSWSQIMFCYKYGNFLRINEIRTFADCYLSYSLIYIQALIGSMTVDLIQNSHRYNSIISIFKSSASQILFETKDKTIQTLFYNNNKQIKLQDTRDFDIWPKIDYRRLRFNENGKSIETLSYADRVLSDNSGQATTYQSPSYKDSYLRQYQQNDFQQRSILCYLRANILNLLHTLYIDPSGTKTESVIHIPDEQALNKLKTIVNHFDETTKSLNSLETMTPCELHTIIDFEFYRSIPFFIQILTDGITFNKSAEATATTTTKLSLSNTTVDFEKINQYINEIINQLQKSYQLLLKALENTSFQKRCEQSSTSEPTDFITDFSGTRSPIEFYSTYTEFMSYIYSLFLSIRSIFATLFNKTSLLIDNNENPSARLSNTKKSKKKQSEQQTSSSSSTNENENEIKLWNQFEKLENLFNEQWTQIIGNIRKYEIYLRTQAKLNDDECDRLEKELDGSNEQQSNKAKSKSDENNNSSEPTITSLSLDDHQPTFELGKTVMRSSTLHTFAIGYLESLIQIRVCLATKQKTLRLRQTST